MENLKWFKRSDDWIKENPKQPTMFKGYINDQGEIIDTTLSKPASKKLRTVIDYTNHPIITTQEEIPMELQKESDKFPKEEWPDPGVYVILFEPQKFVYVGQSKNMANRMRNHKMNILSNTAEAKDKSYYLMRKHRDEYGIKEFKFQTHLKLPGVTSSELLMNEGKTMLLYLEKGYTLYNRQVTKEIINNSVFCPTEFRLEVQVLVTKLMNKELVVNQLTEFMQSIVL